MRSQSGMMLLELLLAMSIAAIVLTGSLATLQTIADANSATTQTFELTSGVQRALRAITREIRDANGLMLAGKRVTVARGDGRYSIFEATADGKELHEFNSSSSLGARAIAFFASIDTFSSSRMSDRGYLLDTDYRTTALVQGIAGVTWVPIYDPGDARFIGLKITVGFQTEAGLRTMSRTAVVARSVILGEST